AFNDFRSATPRVNGSDWRGSVTRTRRPWHASPNSFGFGAASEDAGVKRAGSSANPGVFAAAAQASAFTHGAPTSRNGASVPRPSVAFVPSSRHVPGYASAASAERRFGEGVGHARPVSAQVMLRFQPLISTTVS